jgi:hypothetical protein
MHSFNVVAKFEYMYFLCSKGIGIFLSEFIIF